MQNIRKNKRLLLGIFIVLLILISAFVIDKFLKIVSFNQIIYATDKYQDNLPQNFSNEIFDINGLVAKDIKTAQDNKIIGFIILEGADKVFSQIKSKLEENN